MYNTRNGLFSFLIIPTFLKTVIFNYNNHNLTKSDDEEETIGGDTVGEIDFTPVRVSILEHQKRRLAKSNSQKFCDVSKSWKAISDVSKSWKSGKFGKPVKV